MMDTEIAFDGLCLDNLVPSDANYDLDVLATRISNTDSLLQTFHNKTQELADLKRQLTSLNDSSVRVNAFYQQEQQKTGHLQQELDEARRTITRLQRELSESQHEQLNEASLHKQEVAEHNSEFISLCKQYLIVGNHLADNQLSDGAMNRTYMKVVEMLRRKGESVDGLLKTTSSKKRKPKTATVATMTNPLVEIKPKQTCSISTMTDVQPAVPVPPPKTFCDRSVQHHPTTTTRGTTTSVFIQKVSVGTSFPEPVPLDEIFRQTIIEIPSPISPILDFKWPTVDSGCQTSSVDESLHQNVQVHSIGTITELANVRKRVGYTKLNSEQLQANRNSLGTIYGIKKEESSPAGSMHNLSTMVADNKVPTPPDLRLLGDSAISPQLSSLWSILGQTIFSIIGTGRIFENNPSTLDMINTNLNHIRRVMESGHDFDANAVGARHTEPSGDTNTREQDKAMQPMCLKGTEKNDISKGEAQQMQPESGFSTTLPPAPSQPSAAMVPTAPTTPIEIPTKVLVVPLTSSTSTQCDVPPTDTPPTIQSSTTFISPLRPNPPQSTGFQTSDPTQPDDNVIFKKPTSAVRRLSPRQKAIAMANKKPIVSPSSYSIDRNFKRARRKQKLSLIELQQSSHKQHQHRVSKPHCQPTYSESDSESDTEISNYKRPRLQESPHRDQCSDRDTKMKEIDVWSISQQFKAPQLIEPIMDLDLDMVLFGPSDCDDKNGSDEEMLVEGGLQTKFSSPSHKDCDTELSVIAELMGISSDSDDDSPVQSLENYSDSSSSPCVSPELVSSETSLLNDAQSANHKSLEHLESPASPTPPESTQTLDRPPCIPLETFTSEDKSKTFTARVLHFTKRQSYRPIKKIDATLFLTVFKIINHYLDETECCEVTVTHCTVHLLRVTKSIKILAACLLEITEDIEEPSCPTNGPIPSLTESHKRLLILVERINRIVPGFQEYCLFSVERSLFLLSKQEMKIEAILNLVQLFVALYDVQPNIAPNSRIRLFIYKCLYYFKHTSTPMIYTVLCAFPNCLPVLPQSELLSKFPTKEFEQFDPVVQTIHTCLMNEAPPKITTNPTKYDNQLYKRTEIGFLQRMFYQYPMIRHNFHDLLKHLLDRLRQNELFNVDYALILLAKRKGVNWAKQNVLGPTALPKMLQDFVKSSVSTDEHDDQIVTILTVIGAIVKTYPLADEVTAIHDLFTWTLETVPADRQEVQEAVISAFLMTARSGAMNVHNRIRHWAPPFSVGRKLNTQLQSFFNRKPRDFWT